MKTVLALIALSALAASTATAQEERSRSDTPEREGRSRAEDDRGRDETRGRRGPPNLMFEAIDQDGDGVISKVELRKAISALQQLDADGDGNITLAEATPERGRFGRGDRGGPEEFVDRMMENDANGDGKLTADEVPERMMPMLQGGDTNSDRAIDRAELGAIAERLGQRFGRGGPEGPGVPGGRGGLGGDPQNFIQRLMENDRNGDGKLTPDEVPAQVAQMLRGGDADGDGAIDAQELIQVVDNFRERARGGRGGPGAGGRDNEQFERGGRRSYDRDAEGPGRGQGDRRRGDESEF